MKIYDGRTNRPINTILTTSYPIGLKFLPGFSNTIAILEGNGDITFQNTYSYVPPNNSANVKNIIDS